MRQQSRNLAFGIVICIFVLVSLFLYNSIDTKDQNKKAFILQEESAVHGLEAKLKTLEDQIKDNDDSILRMREKLKRQRQHIKNVAYEKDPIIFEEKEGGVLQLPKKAVQILKEEQNVEQAVEQAKDEIQARRGVLLPPQRNDELEKVGKRGGKVAAVKQFREHANIQNAVPSNDTCTYRLSLTGIGEDVQMLDVYGQLSFDDPDGGVWKQGWPIVYDIAEVQKQKKLEVVVVPHSHTDPGWIKTFEDYYHDQTKNILDAMLTYLLMFKDMRFVYAEISFFEQWWADIDGRKRENVKKLLKDGRLEILTGGWVMTDEANAHYFAIISQLIEGHEWIRNHLGEEYAPVNHWSIDPFGLSPTLSYFISRSNLSNAVVQRVHYAVKKHFAKNKQLEFKWRQLFGGKSAEDDLLTHVMPFFSYDVPHTCGPDPKICCQFDFRRLPGGGVTCPWNVPPVSITDDNLAERAELLYDQYRKKAQLFKTNVVLVPLGDDFRYDVAFEWEQQHSNYRKLFDYMNSKPEWNVHARFGTLAEYFKLMQERLYEDGDRLPVLTGDFFTYSDRNDHYWSGYYTSRPFYKHMDRTVQHFLRSAEILYSFANVKDSDFSSSGEMFNLLVEARRHASLFQHHDGITGTAKDHVVVDYGKKMLAAIKNCEQIMSIAGDLLLHEKSNDGNKRSVFELSEVRTTHDFLPSKVAIEMDREVVLFNSLAQERNEVICIHVKSANAIIRRARAPEIEIMQQIGPVITIEGNLPLISHEKFELCFEAFIPAFGFEKYEVEYSKSYKNKAILRTSSTLNTNMVYGSCFCVYFSNSKRRQSQICFRTKAEKKINELMKKRTLLFFFTLEAAEINNVNAYEERCDFMVYNLSDAKITLANEMVSVQFDGISGFISSITPNGATKTSVDLSFVSYGARGKSPTKFNGGDDLSGAYLFLPDGPAKPVSSKNIVIVVDGPVTKKVVVISDRRISLDHTATLFFNAPYVQLQNLVNITSTANFEIAMRIKSDIQSGEYFATDLNGFQMIRRRRFSKLPLQAQFYPMPGAAFVEDGTRRLSLLGAQANGVASLESGWLEVMLDRRLVQDDGRGLFSGVTDNKRTMSSFRLLVERMVEIDETHKIPIYFHSLFAHQFSLQLHYPPISFFADKDEMRAKTYSGLSSPLPCDLHIVTLRTMAAATIYGDQSSRSHLAQNSQALVIHRLGVDCRPKIDFKTKCLISDGKMSPLAVLSSPPQKVVETSLTLLYTKPQSKDALDFVISPMDIRTFRLDFD